MSRRASAQTPSGHDAVFARLRAILARHAARFTVTADTSDRYCLEGAVGPATLRAWGGKMKRPQIPIAWAGIGKSYVSFHLMAADLVVRDGISADLQKCMQGKTCFNFTTVDDALFRELECLTADGLAAFADAGFITS